MEPLHFGPAHSPLFGMRHLAQGAQKRTAILLCPSWGPEYVRSYRGVRQLANQLAVAGFETLRFDYSGTGDSEGQGLDARVEHWLRDIACAAQELSDLSGGLPIAVFGLRLGALLAQAAHRQKHLRAQQFICWDAPRDGSDFCALMRAQSSAADLEKAGLRYGNAKLPTFQAFELSGHAWPSAFAEAVAALPALENTVPWISFSSADHLPAVDRSVQNVALPDSSYWTNHAWRSSPWVPTRNISSVVQYLSQHLS